MVAPGTFRLLGLIYAYVAMLGAIYQCALRLLGIASGKNLLFSVVGLVLSVMLIIMCLVLIIGIKQKNLKYAKAHRSSVVFAAVVGLIWGTATQIYDMVRHHQMRPEMLVIVVFAVLFVLVIFAVQLWILNGVIRYIESERKLDESAAQDDDPRTLLKQKPKSVDSN